MAGLAFKDYLIGFVMMSVFLTLVVAYIGGISSNYGFSPNALLEDQILVAGGSGNITMQSTLPSQVNSSVEAMGKEFVSPETADENLVLASPLTTAANVWGTIKQTSNVTQTLMASVSIPPIVSTTIFGLIAISLVFAIWRVLRAGE